MSGVPFSISHNLDALEEQRANRYGHVSIELEFDVRRAELNPERTELTYEGLLTTGPTERQPARIILSAGGGITSISINPPDLSYTETLLIPAERPDGP